MKKVFVFYPNKSFTSGCLIIAAESKQQALEILIQLNVEDRTYQGFFDLPSIYYTDEWENHPDNVLNIKFVEELEGISSKHSGIIKTCLFENIKELEYEY